MVFLLSLRRPREMAQRKWYAVDRKMAANELVSGALRNRNILITRDKMPPKFMKSSEKELVRLH